MVLREMSYKCLVRLVVAPEVTRLNPFLLGLLVVRLVLLEPVSKEEEMVHGFLLCFLVIDVSLWSDAFPAASLLSHTIPIRAIGCHTYPVIAMPALAPRPRRRTGCPFMSDVP